MKPKKALCRRIVPTATLLQMNFLEFNFFLRSLKCWFSSSSLTVSLIVLQSLCARELRKKSTTARSLQSRLLNPSSAIQNTSLLRP